MNPYKEDGLRARLSFDPAYCKRCTGPPSVNDGYITGPGYGRRGACSPRQPFLPFHPVHGPAARPQPRRPGRVPRPARPGCATVAPRDTIAAIETLVRQRSNGAFIMRV